MNVTLCSMTVTRMLFVKTQLVALSVNVNLIFVVMEKNVKVFVYKVNYTMS